MTTAEGLTTTSLSLAEVGAESEFGDSVSVVAGGSPRDRLRAHLAIPLFRNAYALMASTLITSVLGVVYWAMAAHFYSAAAVGKASSFVSMMLLISGIAQANQHNMLPRLIPIAGSNVGRLIGRAYLACGSAALAASAGYAVFFGGTTFLGSYHSVGVDIWFVLAVVTWCIFTLQDSVLTGLRATVWVPIENAAFSVAKIVLLVVFASEFPNLGLFAAWTLPVAASIFPITWLVYARLVPRHREVAVTSRYIHDARSRSRYVVADATGGLLSLAATMLLPVVVAARLGFAEAGWFYAAWIVGSAFDSLMLNLTASLTVEGSHDEEHLRDLARSLSRGAPILLVICGAVAAASSPLLSVMGGSYAEHATRLLQLVALGMVFRAIVAVRIALARVCRQVVQLLVIQVSMCVLLLGGSVLLGGGLTGIGIAYAGTQVVVGLAVLPGMVRFLSGGHLPESRLAGIVASVAVRVRCLDRGMVQTAALVTAGFGGATLTIVGLSISNAARIAGFGLANALAPIYWVGLALLVGTAILAALLRPTVFLMAPLCLVLVVACQGAASIVEPNPTLYTAWLHAGFISYIGEHHATDPTLDARFSWPGMFAGVASMLHVAGDPSPLVLLRWASPVLTAVCLPSVWSIAGWVTPNARVRWLSVVLFILGDWVGQDYLSPQAVVYPLALTVVALVVRVLPAAPAGRSLRGWVGPPILVASATAARQRTTILIVVFTSFAIVAAHQLTPIFLLIDAAVLVVLRRTSFASLPGIIFVFFLGWLSLAAEPFWQGHLSLLVGGAGQVGSNVGANVGARVSGDPDHLLIVHVRMVLTVLGFGLAAVGMLRSRDSRRWALGAMAVGPFFVVLVQAYGGEAILRAYLFALPFLAILSAMGIAERPPSAGWSRRGLLGLSCVLALIMASGLVLVRWGNERFESVSAGEVSALNWLYATAPAGSAVVDADQALPWRYTGLDSYKYAPIDSTDLTNAGQAYQLLRQSPTGVGFFVASDAQKWYGIEVGGQSPSWLAHLELRLAHRPGVSLAYVAGDTKLFRYQSGERRNQ